MAKARVWKGVAVAMQSAIDPEIVITGISNEAPAVVTFTGTAPPNGSIVLITAQGMGQVDGRAFRVAASGSGTFELENEDATDYDPFSSGSFAVSTLGTSITSIATISASGGGFSMINTTTIDKTVMTQIPGMAESSSYSIENIWNPITDVAQAEMKRASDLQAERAFRFRFGPAGSPVMLFKGFVAATMLPAGSAQALVTTPAVITLSGPPTFYAN